MQPPPPPSTSFEVTLAQYTVASFNSTYQDAFQETLEDYLELSPSDLSITLSNFHDGSLIFTTLVVFLNGDAAAAAHLYAVLNQVMLHTAESLNPVSEVEYHGVKRWNSQLSLALLCQVTSRPPSRLSGRQQSLSSHECLPRT